MKTNLLLRSADFDVAGDGRTIEGLAFPWDRPSLVTDDGVTRYLEEFHRNATDQTLKMKALRPLFVRHEYIRGSVGETTFTKSAEGLVFRARATDSTFAESTLERVRTGELPSVSVGFRAIKSVKRSDARGPVTVRAEIAIEELSLAEQGQHVEAKVLAVRAEEGTPRLDALRRRKLLLLS